MLKFNSPLLVALLAIFVALGCKSETKFGSGTDKKPLPGNGKGDGDGTKNPNDPENNNIGGQDGKDDPDDLTDPDNPNRPNNPNNPKNPTKDPTKPCVDEEGKTLPAKVVGFTVPGMDLCLNGSASQRGLFDFPNKTCIKPNFTQFTCNKETVAAKIAAAGMSNQEFLDYANGKVQTVKSAVVFLQDKCGEFTGKKGEKIILVQFYQFPSQTLDPKKCTYDSSETGGGLVTGCYIKAVDNTWQNLTAAQKVARCFAEVPRK